MPAKAQEIWEATTQGTTYINVRDPRNSEGWVHRKVGGKGSKRITVSVEEREFNQELVQYENKHNDPFTNGMLVRISPKDGTHGENEKTDEQLIVMLAVDDDKVFDAALHSIDSELIIRRMLTLSKTHGTMARHEVIQTLVDERYHVGKTSRVFQEQEEDDRRYVDI